MDRLIVDVGDDFIRLDSGDRRLRTRLNLGDDHPRLAERSLQVPAYLIGEILHRDTQLLGLEFRRRVIMGRTLLNHETKHHHLPVANDLGLIPSPESQVGQGADETAFDRRPGSWNLVKVFLRKFIPTVPRETALKRPAVSFGHDLKRPRLTLNV